MQSSLKTRLAEIKSKYSSNDIPIPNLPSEQEEIGTFHGIYRKASERGLFIAICRQRLANPTITSRITDEFLQWLAPSWYISNGYIEARFESIMLQWMLAKHGAQNTEILNRILHTIHFIQLHSPLDIQEELVKWILDCNNSPILQD